MASQSITDPASKLVPIRHLRSKHKLSMHIEKLTEDKTRPYAFRDVISEGQIMDAGILLSQNKRQPQLSAVSNFEKGIDPLKPIKDKSRLQGEPLTPTPLKKGTKFMRFGSFSHRVNSKSQNKHSLSQLEPLSPVRAKNV